MGTERKKLVMVVCPDRTRRCNIRNGLARAGIRPEMIVEIGDITSALANLMTYEFTMIFSDHNGVINALDFLKQLKEFEKGKFKNIPFVIIAKKGVLEDVFEAGKLGVMGFILFDPPATTEFEFLKKLKDLLTGWLI
ncbi:MAG: hypothetical protein PHZ04_02990 [Patescibacteria group bacterium]|nr:hypothetical protein [Patescibacteria group bacterium]MDD5294383.1 hypothetical protein [Patescibacteria group bacterium]MDD5554670.1 hypothetical protein [Patescibacteria group bacterium]